MVQICTSCGCQTLDSNHGDSRSITLTDLRSAAEAAGISVALAAQNITKAASSVTKMSQGADAAGVVLKANDEKRYLLSVAYPAYRQDVAVAADGHIDVASADVVERAAWNFMRKGCKVGLWHQEGNPDAALVVESYIYRADPWVIKAADGTEQIVMPGDWLVGSILSVPTWNLYKSGRIGGVSPQGGARRQAPSEETLARMRSRINGA